MEEEKRYYMMEKTLANSGLNQLGRKEGRVETNDIIDSMVREEHKQTKLNSWDRGKKQTMGGNYAGKR